MLFLVVTCAARYVDLGDGVHVRPAAGTSLDLGVGIEVDDLVSSCPLATNVGAVSDKDAVAKGRVDFLA